GTTPFIGRVTAVNGGGASVDVDSTKAAGTRPSTAASGVTARLGGPWLGPNGSTAFPFGFIAAAATDGNGNLPCCNLQHGTTYPITAAMTHSLNSSTLHVTGAGKRTAPGRTVRLRDVMEAIDGRESFKLGLENNGLCFVVAYCLELLTHRNLKELGG